MFQKSNSLRFTVLLTLLLSSFAAAPSFAQDDDSDSDIFWLRWKPELGAVYTYMLSTSGTHGESIMVNTENFRIEVVDIGGPPNDYISLVAWGEDVPENAPLAFRFQRSLFPEFPYTVDSYGNTEAMTGQPFPPFLNVPILPEDRITEGMSWAGGPVGILPDANVGAIPFTCSSTVTSIADYRGDECVFIDTVYEVAIEEGKQSFMPFLGLVEGDVGEEAGQGAPVGGVVEDSRAHEAGIEPGDFIIEAEGQRIRGWGGLEAIIPVLVPEMPVEFRVRRGDEEFEIEITPEGVPLAFISATGGLRSTCYFSIERGIPMKIDLVSEDLIFTLSNAEGEEDVREIDLHYILEYQRGG